jgi:Raf kinase inhibitor-like YbhB/YbcL family protein
MKNKKTIIFILILMLVIIVWFGRVATKDNGIITPTKLTMNLSSSAFDNDEIIPSLYTCRGVGNHPPLTITGVSKKTISLVLIVDDPDAPTGTFVHWLVWAIEPSTMEMGDSLPRGMIEGENSIGQNGYFAPCPPTGTHHYHFKLYALDNKLELTGASNKSELEKAMMGHVVDQTELVGLVKAE